MRKSNLVKAMACFMAATMAVTCVPSAGITNNLAVVASAAEDGYNTIKDTVTEKKIVNAGWWDAFSDYYQLEGDFDVTFNISNEGGSNNWNNPYLYITTPYARDTEGYKVFAGIRSDCWSDTLVPGDDSKANLTSDGHAITYNSSWGSDWGAFLNAMKKATIRKNVIRCGNNFTIVDTITSGQNTYTCTTSFTDESVGATVNLFLTTNNAYMEINSFSGNIFADGMKNDPELSYEDGTYLISAKNSAVNGNTIDVSKMFKKASGNISINNNIAKFPVDCGVDASGSTVTKEVTLELLQDNPCTNIKPEVDNIKISLNETIDLASILTGEKSSRVTELTTAKMENFQETDADDLVALPEKLRTFFTVDHSHIKLESLTDNNAKDNKTTTINKVIGKEDNTTGFWSEFSDYYPLEGNFDVTFNFINYSGDYIDPISGGPALYDHFTLALSSDADRNADGYKEYAVIRADKWGWTGDLGATNLAGYADGHFGDEIFTICDYDFATFDSDMKGAKVSMNLKRENNTIVMTAKITPKDSEKTYTYQTTLAYSVGDKDSVAANISDAKRDSSNKNRSIHTITSKVAGKGNIVLSAGTAPQKTISYECVNNTCSAISCVVGNGGNVVVNQAGSIAVTAKGKDADVKLNDAITIEDKNGVDVTLASSNVKNGETTNVYYVVSNVATTAAIKFKCGTQETTASVTFKASSGTTTTTPGGTTTPGTTTPGTTTPGTPETPTGPAITTGGAVNPGDANKPGDENKPGDNQPGNTEDPGNNNENPTTPEEPETPTTTKKKKAKVSAVKAAKGTKKVTGTVKLSSGKVVKKATVKVYVNNKKKKTVTTNNKGKFTAKLSKKLKKGDKVKVVITKSTIKKITKTVKVK